MANRKRRADGTMRELPPVSVVIPVFNGERTIGRLIESLLATDYPSKEIIVVDNNSTDRTTEIVSKYPVLLLSEKRQSSYVARNAGISKANGRIVLFTDTDCVVDRQWIRNMVKNFRDSRVWGVGGMTLPYFWPYAPLVPKTLVEKYGVFVSKTPQKDGLPVRLSKVRGDFHSGFFPTENASFTADVLREVGMFDEEFTSGGDLDICHRMLDRGGTLLFDPTAIVYHTPRGNIVALIQQSFNYGVGVAHLLKKDSRMRMYLERDFLKIVPNLLRLVFGVATAPFHREDALFRILSPIVDSIRVLSLTAGKIVGSFKYKVIAV